MKPKKGTPAYMAPEQGDPGTAENAQGPAYPPSGDKKPSPAPSAAAEPPELPEPEDTAPEAEGEAPEAPEDSPEDEAEDVAEGETDDPEGEAASDLPDVGTPEAFDAWNDRMADLLVASLTENMAKIDTSETTDGAADAPEGDEPPELPEPEADAPEAPTMLSGGGNPYHDDLGRFATGPGAKTPMQHTQTLQPKPPPETDADRYVREHARDVDAVTFEKAFSAAMAGNPRTGFVTHYSLTELEAMKDRIATVDGKAGVAVHDHGDGRIEGTALFNTSSVKGTGLALLRKIVRERGVNYCECFGDQLRSMYEKQGFEVQTASDFNEEYAPKNWNYDLLGRPKYYTMKLKGAP